MVTLPDTRITQLYRLTTYYLSGQLKNVSVTEPLIISVKNGTILSHLGYIRKPLVKLLLCLIEAIHVMLKMIMLLFKWKRIVSIYYSKNLRAPFAL